MDHCPACHGEWRPRTVFAGYELLRCHARSGLGLLFQASHKATGETVALKLLRPCASTTGEEFEHFKKELALLSSFDHPHWVRVLEGGVQDGMVWVAMEWLERGSLAGLLAERGRLPEIEALNFAAQLAAALAAAETVGVLHHDIEPNNVLVADPATLKLADFAQTVFYTRAALDAETIWGRVGCVPPERMERADEDARSDMYGLGTLLVHMLNGSPLYREETLAEMMGGPAPTSALQASGLRKSLHRTTTALLNQLLRTNPEQRFKSWEAAISAIDEARAAVSNLAMNAARPQAVRAVRRPASASYEIPPPAVMATKAFSTPPMPIVVPPSPAVAAPTPVPWTSAVPAPEAPEEMENETPTASEDQFAEAAPATTQARKSKRGLLWAAAAAVILAGGAGGTIWWKNHHPVPPATLAQTDVTPAPVLPLPSNPGGAIAVAPTPAPVPATPPPLAGPVAPPIKRPSVTQATIPGLITSEMDWNKWEVLSITPRAKRPKSASARPKTNGTLRMETGHAGVTDTGDDMLFLAREAAGDWTLSGHVSGANARNSGIMVRASKDPGSPFLSVTFNSAMKAFSTHSRREPDAKAAEGKAPPPIPKGDGWVRFRREGSKVSAFYSADNQAWNPIAELELPGNVLVGFVSWASSANFDDIHFEGPK